MEYYLIRLMLIYFPSKCLPYFFSQLMMSGECVISSVLSHHNKNLKQQTLHLLACHSSWTDQCYSSMLQLSFIQKIKENISLRSEGMPIQKTQRERQSVGERPLALWLLFLYVFFSSPLDLPYINWASQECYLFYLRSSLWSSELPLFYFCWLFPSLSFSHGNSGLLFPILAT